MSIPTSEPIEIRAGDTITWKKSLSDYPAGTWTLSYYLLKDGTQITFDATDDNDDHLVEIDAATSAGYAAGKYKWIARATDGTNVYTVDDGVVDILPDLTAETSGHDWRENARVMLDLIRDLLAGKVVKDVARYSINGRSADSYSIPELIELEKYYARKVLNLERKAGRAKPKTYGVQF